MSQRVLTADAPEALTRVVELEQDRHQRTLEALADVDAGRVVAHGEVVTWAASLRPKPARKR